MRSTFGLVLLALLAAASAAARDLFVDNVNGDDGFAGRRWESTIDRAGPLRTIARAVEMARTGDHIVLAKTAQPYRESISLMGSWHGGLERVPFLIAGNGAILDGSAPVPPRAWKFHAGRTFVFQPPTLGHQQLFLNNMPLPQVPLPTTAKQLPEMEPLHWCLFGGQIYLTVEADKLPGDYALSYAARETGITLTHVEFVTITDLIVQGFRADGINAANSARDIRLVNVKTRGNGRCGVAVGGACIVGLDGCLLGNNGEAQLISFPLSETHITNCWLLSTGVPAWVDRGGKVFIDGRLAQGGREAINPAEETASPEKTDKPVAPPQ